MRTEQIPNLKKLVLSICKSEAFQHLNDNHPKVAHPAGLQTLRYAADGFENIALELVSPYFLSNRSQYFSPVFFNKANTREILGNFPLVKENSIKL
jgi:hypothetical protein